MKRTHRRSFELHPALPGERVPSFQVPESGEGMLELRVEVHGCSRCRLCTFHRSFTWPVSSLLPTTRTSSSKGAVGAVCQLEEQVAGGRGWETDSGDAGACGDRQLHVGGRGSKCDPVTPGFGRLVVIGKGVGGRRGDAGDRPDGRENREVTFARTAGSAQMGEAESADLGVRIVVPAGVRPIRGGVGTPLHHAERQGSAGGTRRSRPLFRFPSRCPRRG